SPTLRIKLSARNESPLGKRPRSSPKNNPRDDSQPTDRHRPGHGRGTSGRVYQTEHQNLRQTVGPEIGSLDDGPDDAGRQRYARENRVPLPESDETARTALRCSLLRR